MDEFVDSNLEREGLQNIRRAEIGAWIEAVVIAAQQERERKRMNNEGADVSYASNLFVRNKAIIDDVNSEKDKRAHAEDVMRILSFDANPSFSGKPYPTLGKHYFLAVDLIEMISPKTS